MLFFNYQNKNKKINMEKEIEEMNKFNITEKLMESKLEENNGNSELVIQILPNNYTKYDKSIKIILLGDSGVGKTSIINCLLGNGKDKFENDTVSLEYFNYNIKVNNYIIRMKIWDTVGHEKFNSITSNYYKTADVAVFIYAINDMNSFNNINNWFNELKDKNNAEIEDKNMIKILVGNKNDLINERKVTYETGEQMKKDKSFYLFEEINCYNINNNDFGKGKILTKDYVKDLFVNIGKIIYKKDSISRVNSSIYAYEASKSILDIPEESRENTKYENKKNKLCCC